MLHKNSDIGMFLGIRFRERRSLKDIYRKVKVIQNTSKLSLF
jgi:hypothetical protein